MAIPTLWRSGSPSAWSDLYNSRRELDRVFDRFFSNVAADAAVGLSPAVDIRETKDVFEVTAELPGIDPKSVEVSIENHVLTIGGEKVRVEREADDSSYRLIERSYGRFERSFTLPRTVDTEKVKAGFEHGLLTVTLPKAEAAKPRRIEVSVAK